MSSSSSPLSRRLLHRSSSHAVEVPQERPHGNNYRQAGHGSDFNSPSLGRHRIPNTCEHQAQNQEDRSCSDQQIRLSRGDPVSLNERDSALTTSAERAPIARDCKHRTKRMSEKDVLVVSSQVAEHKRQDGAEGDRHPQPRDNSRTFFSLRVQHSHGRHTHILRVTPREISVSTSHPQADSAKCTQVESEFLQTVPGS